MRYPNEYSGRERRPFSGRPSRAVTNIGLFEFLFTVIVFALVILLIAVGVKLSLESRRLTGETDDPCAEFLKGPNASYPAFEMCKKQQARFLNEK